MTKEDSEPLAVEESFNGEATLRLTDTSKIYTKKVKKVFFFFIQGQGDLFSYLQLETS